MMFKNTIVGFAAVLLMAGCSAEQASNTEDNAAPAGNAQANADGSHTGVIQGVVTDGSGQPVAGAFVKLRDEAQRLDFMFISQEGGRYMATMLPAGNFSVQAVGGDFQSDWSAPVTINETDAGTMNVSLDVERVPALEFAWPRRASEATSTMDTLPEGHGKDLVARNCVICHTVNRIAASRKDANEWANTIQDMQERREGSGFPVISDEDVEALYNYLVENLPPIDAPDPNARLPRELMTGEAMHYRVVQYNLPNIGAEPHDVAVDPWGHGWANQRVGGKVSHFNPITYEYEEVGPPLYTRERARPGNLQISEDGTMWLPDPFEIRWVSYDIANKRWTDYPYPVESIRGNVQGNSMALHPDGTIWESGPGAARRLNPATGEWSTWDTPSFTRTGQDPGGYGNTIDGAGRFWLALEVANKMARFDGETGEVVEYDIPIPEAFPRRMDTDPNGDVWVGLWAAGKFLKINHITGEMEVIEPPIEHGGTYALDFDDTNGYMWTTFHTADRIGRYNPETKEWLLLPLMQSETDVRRVEVDQHNPNRIWWSGVAYNARMGFVELTN
jgi:streptogramin lyase/mono/diheme cytochrome c family protein